MQVFWNKEAQSHLWYILHLKGAWNGLSKLKEMKKKIYFEEEEFHSISRLTSIPIAEGMLPDSWLFSRSLKISENFRKRTMQSILSILWKPQKNYSEIQTIFEELKGFQAQVVKAQTSDCGQESCIGSEIVALKNRLQSIYLMFTSK